jgi:hypothetical protein
MNLPLILASFGETDRAASLASAWLSQSPLLTDREQTLYGSTIAEQERVHGETSLAWARAFGWQPEQGFVAHALQAQKDLTVLSGLSEPRRTACTLATMRAAELGAVKAFAAIAKVLARASETAKVVGDYTDIARDERMHVAANLAIVRRLGENDPAFRRMEREAFEAAQATYTPTTLGQNVIRALLRDVRARGGVQHL